jgi:hypothetical protein
MMSRPASLMPVAVAPVHLVVEHGPSSPGCRALRARSDSGTGSWTDLWQVESQTLDVDLFAVGDGSRPSEPDQRAGRRRGRHCWPPSAPTSPPRRSQAAPATGPLMPGARCETEVVAMMTEVGDRLGARTSHMFGHPALYVGRRLVVCAYGAGLGLKLPADRVNELINTGRAVHFQPNGKPPMREWAYGPAATSDDVTELADLIAEAIDFAHRA